MSDQSNYIDQAWPLAGGNIQLRLISRDPMPAGLVADLGAVVAAIEAFLETWGPPMPEWERQLLSDGKPPA